MNGKNLAIELCQTWQNLAEQYSDPETVYRLRKMSGRLHPVVDRIFFKTLLAEELVRECIEMTASIGIGAERTGWLHLFSTHRN